MVQGKRIFGVIIIPINLFIPQHVLFTINQFYHDIRKFEP